MTFYIYVDGCDLGEIADSLVDCIAGFVARFDDRVSVVNQRQEPPTNPVDLPLWDIGVNFDSDSLSGDEVGALLAFFQRLSVDFRRDFILGGLSAHGQSDDFHTISGTASIEPAISTVTRIENHRTT